MSPEIQPFAHIPLRTALLCNNEHLFDGARFHDHCPACGSKEVMSVSRFLEKKPKEEKRDV